MFYGYRENGGGKPTYQELTYKVLVRNSDVAYLRMSVIQAESQEKGVSGKRTPGTNAPSPERTLHCLQLWKKAHGVTGK